MLQAVLKEPRKIEIREVPKPTLGGGDVLIKVRNLGICGSDIHIFYGKHIYKEYPIIPGHEISGEVAEVTPSIEKIKVGDKVTLRPQLTCRKCYNCLHGNYHICENLKVIGFHIPGAAGEYLSAPYQNIITLPDNISFEDGAMIEPVAVAVHALKKCENISGKKVLVFGAGPIGNLVAQTAKAYGAVSVMITDRVDFRLKIASDCGIDWYVNVLHKNLRQEILDKFGSNGADLILECVGIEDTIEEAIELTRKGTDVIIVGVPEGKLSVNLGLVQDRELKLIGSLMYKEEDFYEAIRLISEDKIKVKELITNRFPFKQYPEAFKFIDEGKNEFMKVMIYF